MKKTVVSLIAATALTAGAVAFAGGPDVVPAPSHSGFYAGADLGYAYSPDGIDKELTKADIAALSDATKDNKGFAFGAHLGYQFNQYIALEGGYMRLPKVGYEQNHDFIGFDDTNVFYGAVKGSYPVIDNLSVFAKAGYAVVKTSLDEENTTTGVSVTDASSTNYMPLVGAGVEYRVLPKLGVNVAYTALIRVGKASNGNHFPTTHIGTVGLNYYF